MPLNNQQETQSIHTFWRIVESLTPQKMESADPESARTYVYTIDHNLRLLGYTNFYILYSRMIQSRSDFKTTRSRSCEAFLGRRGAKPVINWTKCSGVWSRITGSP